MPPQQAWPLPPQATHVPLLQYDPDPQECPHVPQLFESVCVLLHVPLQLLSPVGQQMPLAQLPLAHSPLPLHGSPLGSSVHTPPTHCSVARQTVAHPPQWLRSVCRLTQAVPHSVSPPAQLIPHRPLVQVAVPLPLVGPGQAWPQTPQFVVVFRGVQTLPQQPWPLGQVWPQAPQLFVSVLGFTQLPAQTVCPVGQPQAPLTQSAPLGQACPQAPQSFASVCKFRQPVEQQLGRLAGQQLPWQRSG